MKKGRIFACHQILPKKEGTKDATPYISVCDNNSVPVVPSIPGKLFPHFEGIRDIKQGHVWHQVRSFVSSEGCSELQMRSSRPRLNMVPTRNLILICRNVFWN